MTNQHTLKDSISFSGIGLHTGIKTAVRVEPLDENSGFILAVQVNNKWHHCPGNLDRVISTSLCTTLGNNHFMVHTVEHILSALFGLAVDNALIKVDGPEIPIMDGSSLFFASEINRVGLKCQNSPKKILTCEKKIPPFYEDKKGAKFEFSPANNFTVAVKSFGQIEQQYSMDFSTSNYLQQICLARTYCFFHDIDKMRRQNLIKGGSLNNALVLNNDGRPINTSGFRLDQEPIRHKILDLYGDISLLGAFPLFKISATNSGHTSLINTLKHLRDKLQLQ